MDSIWVKLFAPLMRSPLGSAIRAGASFVTVSIFGAIALVTLAIVLWAAALTPFGLWAALPVIAAAAIVAALAWQRERSGADGKMELNLGRGASLAGLDASRPSKTGTATARKAPDSLATQPLRVRLLGPEVAPPAVSRQSLPRPPRNPDADDLRRMFDQAYAAGQSDAAEKLLGELAGMPGQLEWTQRKLRLVKQQRMRS